MHDPEAWGVWEQEVCHPHAVRPPCQPVNDAFALGHLQDLYYEQIPLRSERCLPGDHPDHEGGY